MGQHHLLNAAARKQSLDAEDLDSVDEPAEEAAYQTFRRLRWPQTEGEPVCPRCGGLEYYNISTRRRFKCKACRHQFSVTSGTIFASRKLSFRKLLRAIDRLVAGSKGKSSIELSWNINVQYKTALVLSHKVREALKTETEGVTLSGLVDVDGMYVGGTIRQRNHKKNRIDRRWKRYQTGKRRVVVAIRQREGRTLTFVVKSESEGTNLVRDNVQQGSIIFHDEAAHWLILARHYQTACINHQEAYSKDGVHTNFVESFFARARNMVRGIHHHVSPQYLHLYAGHAGWREDHRRLGGRDLTYRALGAALAAPISRDFKGYWQRRRVAA